MEEGVVFLKEYSVTNKKKVYKRRWCRIQQNSLYCFEMKNEDKKSPRKGFKEELKLVCKRSLNYDLKLSLIQDDESLFCFSLYKKDKENGLRLGFESERERKVWLWSLTSEISSNPDTLKMNFKKIFEEQLKNVVKESGDAVQLYEPHFKITFCCKNLLKENGQAPNSMLRIQLKSPRSQWKEYTRTEIIENSSEPFFYVSLVLIKEMELTDIKILIFDIKERDNFTGTLLAEISFSIKSLLQSPSQTLQLNLVSPNLTGVGIIMIKAVTMTKPKQRNVWLEEEEDVKRMRCYSLPSSQKLQGTIPCMKIFEKFSRNFSIQAYCIRTRFDTELLIHELMLESQTSFRIPCILLEFWINEEKKLMDSLFTEKEIPKDWQHKALAALNYHLTFISDYVKKFNILSSLKEASLKPSRMREEKNLEFIPNNLHIQRMWVENAATHRTGVCDIITVGAFAAYSRSFHKGGLMQLINNLKNYYPLFSPENSCGYLGADPISCSTEDIMKIEHLDEHVESYIKIIIEFFNPYNTYSQTTSKMIAVLNALSSKGDELIRVISPHLVEESSSFLASISDQASLDSTEYSNIISILKTGSLDVVHLNIKASIICITSKVQSFIADGKKESSIEPAGNIDKLYSWTDDLMPSITKLRQAIQCLMKAAKLNFSIVSLKESTKRVSLFHDVRLRRDIVFSQALTSVVTGLMTRLWCCNPDPIFIGMLNTVGILCHFEGLLSCMEDGKGALQDMFTGIDDIRRVIFQFDNIPSHQPRIEGNRLFPRVIVPAPPSVLRLLCDNTNKYFKINLAFFNIGINAKATIAENSEDIYLQDEINEYSLGILKDLFLRFQSLSKADGDQSFKNIELKVKTLLEELDVEIHSHKKKNVAILHLSSEICNNLRGIRLTSCKSAKDRTGMSVTLEQAKFIIKNFNVKKEELPHILDCMRSEGTRIQNCLKNKGKRSFHFNNADIEELPQLYQPPAGTYTVNL